MAVYDLEEQEQISELKAWWAQYGNFVVTLALVAALTSVGWQAWNWYQNRNAGEAGARRDVLFRTQPALRSEAVEVGTAAEQDRAGQPERCHLH